MGCDIHFYVERKVDGKWVTADTWTPDEYDAGRMCVPYKTRLYRDRNYDLFAMLANVRNGYGFAGCDTGDGFKPLSEPKGLPADVSPEVKAESDHWGVDGHSHSWLTLTELKAYDWHGQKTNHRGYVDQYEYAAFKDKGKPMAWCGGTSARTITNKEMEALLAAQQGGDDFMAALKAEGAKALGRLVYTQIEWSESYAQCARRFLEETIPALEKLSYGNFDSVRAVFWFDN